MEGRGFKLQNLHPKKMSRLFGVCHVGNPRKSKAANSRHAGRQNGHGQAAGLRVPRNIQMKEVVV